MCVGGRGVARDALAEDAKVRFQVETPLALPGVVTACKAYLPQSTI